MGNKAESIITTFSIRNQRTAVVKGHSRAPPPSLAERKLGCDEECVQKHPDLIRCASSQLLLWQRHCRGFGSSEDLSECLKIWGGVDDVLRSALDCNSLKTGGKWGRGKGIRTWLCERFELLSHRGIFGSARSIKDLFHPWSLFIFCRSAHKWARSADMDRGWADAVAWRGSLWDGYPLLPTPIPFMPCCGLSHRRRAQLPYVSVRAQR